MSEKQFKLSSETVLHYQIMNNNTDLNENEVVDLLNKLYEENEQLRKQCFELEKDYVIETSDISDKIYLDEELKELKKKYGVPDECETI